MSEVNPRKYLLPVVDRRVFVSIQADFSKGGFKDLAELAEDNLVLRNHDLYDILGFLATLAGWTGEETAAARHTMALTHEVLWRQAELDSADQRPEST